MNKIFPYHNQAIRKQFRLQTLEVKVGDLIIGGGSPIKIQTMTTTDTMDTQATLAETIRCIKSGAELVRITTPSIKEARNLRNIKNKLRADGFQTPLVADVHFTANAAEIAAEIVEKVRINPGNYVDKKKAKEYSELEYQAELESIYQRLKPLITICKREGTALRIGVNHGSLSSRIVMRYGDTPIGMVESAMEFLRMARMENFHNIVLSMKSSNPIIMVHAYRLLVEEMLANFKQAYPLHLGVTEAGDGLSGRIKSASGIGTLLAEGLGDTIRVSLTEDPEFELPVARLLAQKFNIPSPQFSDKIPLSYNPISYQRQQPPVYPRLAVNSNNPPLIIADAYGILHKLAVNSETHNYEDDGFDFSDFGYSLKKGTDKNSEDYQVNNFASDLIILPFIPKKTPPQLKLIIPYELWSGAQIQNNKIFPLCSLEDLERLEEVRTFNNSTNLFILINITKPSEWEKILEILQKNIDLITNSLLLIKSDDPNSALVFRNFALYLHAGKINLPLIWVYTFNGLGDGNTDYKENNDALAVDIAGSLGGVLIDGMGAGLCLLSDLPNSNNTLLKLGFSLLQSTRLRISSTDYISCPSCGRTLFDLQMVTQKIKSATQHLPGVKIGIMGCIVNGPGEMADADFGYVGSGKNRINLYKGHEIVRRNVDSAIAVETLIDLIKEYGMWVDP